MIIIFLFIFRIIKRKSIETGMQSCEQLQMHLKSSAGELAVKVRTGFEPRARSLARCCRHAEPSACTNHREARSLKLAELSRFSDTTSNQIAGGEVFLAEQRPPWVLST